MDKETHKKLIKDFPKNVVQPAPKGKFGSYVPHHLYTQRLVDVVGGKYNFFVKEVIRDKDNAVVGAVCVLEIEGLGRMEEVGDVDLTQINRKQGITESEILKLAVSDGLKRCCMRFGIGLELWTGGVSEEEHYAGEQEQPKKKQVAQEIGKSPSKPIITEIALKKMVMSRCNDDKNFASKCYKQCLERTIIKTNVENVEQWTRETIQIFEDLVDIYIDKHKDTFEERTGNAPIVNKIIENLGEIEEKNIEENKEEEVADIPDGPWKLKKISDGQIGFINTLSGQAKDQGLNDLYDEAKKLISNDEATQGDASAMIDKLKDALS
tara:strand:+ start:1084 stop:2052 length:969 start_codon:yes stop_codon:yes gene_type:complete